MHNQLLTLPNSREILDDGDMQIHGLGIRLGVAPSGKRLDDAKDHLLQIAIRLVAGISATNCPKAAGFIFSFADNIHVKSQSSTVHDPNIPLPMTPGRAPTAAHR